MKLYQNIVFCILLGAAGMSSASTFYQTAQVERLTATPQSDLRYQGIVFGTADNAAVIPEATTYLLRNTRMSHVPEPEGWTMLLLGLGFVVYQIRRRRAKNSSWDLKKN